MDLIKSGIDDNGVDEHGVGVKIEPSIPYPIPPYPFFISDAKIIASAISRIVFRVFML